MLSLLFVPQLVPTAVATDTCTKADFTIRGGSELDAGWNGAGHDAAVVEGASIELAIVKRCGGGGAVCDTNVECSAGVFCQQTCDCRTTGDPSCEITGPSNLGRCFVAIHKTCSTNADCSSPGDGGQCVKFFGPPLPLSAEGTPTCVTTYFQENISGTLHTSTGAMEFGAFLRARVHLGIGTANPCPTCGTLAQDPDVGDTFTCAGGPRNGRACTVDGVSPDFGGTSYDCPPDSNANVSGVGLAIKFNSVSTGTRTLDALLPCGGSLAGSHPSSGDATCLDNSDPCTSNADCQRCTEDPTTACTSNADCTGAGSCAQAPTQPVSCGVYCHCGFCDGDPDEPCISDAQCEGGATCEQGFNATQQLQGNNCTDRTCGLGGFEQCCSSDDPNCANPTALVGECIDQPFRGCNNNSDCTNAGANGPCNLFNRPCFENQISRTGEPSPLGSYCVSDPDIAACSTNQDCGIGSCVKNASHPTIVALFCIPPTASASINAAAGIPGPAAIALHGAMLFDGTSDACICGDDVVECVEQCDDGNTSNGDGCDSNCTPTGCGNGIVTEGEDCDPGTEVVGDCCNGDCSYVPSATVCRSAVGVCDVAETCDGASAECRADSLMPSTLACRLAAGPCDITEHCTGSGPNCPANSLQPSTTVCRPLAGACDLVERCTGTSATCPSDMIVTDQLICRPPVGSCDAAEYCTGTVPECPLDELVSIGTPCADDGDVCTDNICDGAAVCVAIPNTVPCSDNNACTLGDQCTDGECVSKETLECDDGVYCNGLETCDPGAACTVALPVDCSELSNTCALGFCDEDTDTCEAEPINEGIPCSELDSCWINPRCQAGSCTGEPVCNPFCEQCDTVLGCIPRCGHPVSDALEPVVASDALFALQAAVGAQQCPACVCDVDNNGIVAASDSLRLLNRATGLDVLLTCSPSNLHPYRKAPR